MGQVISLFPTADRGQFSPTASLNPLELALDASGVGLWDWDIASGKASHSRINKQMLGFEDSEELGGTFAELAAKIHPDDAKEMQARVARHLRDETTSYCAEFRVLRKDGSYAWFESRGLVVERGPHGEPLRMVGIHLDISDRKANDSLRQELEKALRRNQDELEELVRLQTRKLIDAADEAEQGNRAKNVLLARVGEELRRPLNVMLESCSRLTDGSEGDTPAPIHEQLELIVESSHQLCDSVDRLLDVHRIETNTLEILGTPVNLRQVLEEECESMQARALDRGLDLRGVRCGEDLVVFADRARLAQVVRELLTNAIRFTDHGYVRVRARVIEGAVVLVEVQDTGIGIPQDQQATLFHAFQPAGGEQRSLRRGLGLGLSISRALIDAMAGSIGVMSRVGHGSRFWFTLPLAASAQIVSSTRH
jgi:two-component system sensor histidine kinase/response regulator